MQKRIRKSLLCAALAALTLLTAVAAPAPRAEAAESLPFPVGICAHMTGTYQSFSPEEQLYLAAQLGCRMIRIDTNITSLSDAEYLDQYIALADAYGFDIMAIVYDAEGAETVAKRYGKFIRYYQMSNEQDAVTIAFGDGASRDQYNVKKMDEVCKNLTEIAEALHKYAPDAMRIINMTYTHYGFLDHVIDRKVPFDAIGLDWYSHMIYGIDNALDDLHERFHLPIFICECNTWNNQNPEDTLQSGNYLISCINICREKAKTHDIRAFVAYELLDEPEKRANVDGVGGEREGYFGLVEVNDDYQIVGPKIGYTDLQEYLGFRGKTVKKIPLSSVDADQFNVVPSGPSTPDTPAAPVTPVTPTTPQTPTAPPAVETPVVPEEPADEAFVPETLEPVRTTVEDHQYIDRPFPIWLPILAVACVLLSGGAIAFLALRRRKQALPADGPADDPTDGTPPDAPPSGDTPA